MKLRKLTDIEREFADENKIWIEKYLSMRHLSRDDFYSIVVPGYLLAVIKYLNIPELGNYAFSTIAFRAMDSKISNFHQDNNRLKRKHTEVSMDAEISDAGMTLHNVIPAPEFGGKAQNNKKRLENRLLLNKMFKCITADEREIWELRSRGYTYREIGDFCNITASKAGKSMYKIRKRLQAAFSDIYTAS